MTDMALLRIGHTDTERQGVLLKDGVAFAVTLELPEKGNEPERSCIPAGTYTCKRVQSPHFGETFEVTGVNGRSHILFHKGNTTHDTKGCILVGEKYTELAIGESKEGYDEFMGKFKGRDSFILSVIDVHKYLPTT